jgi:UPF0755 protein
LTAALAGYLLINQKIGDPGRHYVVRIHPDDTAADLRRELQREGLEVQPTVYSLLMRLSGADKRLLPGRYRITGDLTHWELVQVFRRGRVEMSRVTMPEGLPYWRVVPMLAREVPADSAALLELVTDPDFATELGVAGHNLEGYLYPETYTFPAEESPRRVLTTMVEALMAVREPLLNHSRTVGLNPHELVILASLVEAEASAGDERGVISSVFHNRRRQGWRLQCDPTVIYALGGLDRPLYTRDLDFESPYNTYLHTGLPPGPICSPGKASLEAAAQPAETDYYYFVADGRGGHIFSRTLREHNRAREQIKRERRGGG